jgi:hypothetical protein
VAFGSGNGTTTFNLPDPGGRFVRGLTSNTARDPDTASRTAMNSGGNTGSNIGSVQGDAYAAHTHGINAVLQTGFEEPYNIGSGADANFNHTGNTASSGASTETRPKNFYMNFIIKT